MGALLTTIQALLLTYRYNGGTVQDAADAFRLTVPETRQAEAEAMRVLREAGHDAAAIREAFTRQA